MTNFPLIPRRLFLGTGVALSALALLVAACAHSSGGSPSGVTLASAPMPAVATGMTPTGDVSLAGAPAMRYPANAPVAKPDPRIGLKAGASVADAGSAAWNMRLLSNSPPSECCVTGTGSDIAFTGKYAILGNYRGFQIWDVSTPTKPTLAVGFLCPTSQGDPTVFGNLLFISGEDTRARNDCGTDALAQDSASGVAKDRFRGIRVLDISDKAHPKIVTNIQTCRGSHTNTLVEDPKDKNNIYIYVSGYSGIRPEGELGGCKGGLAGDSGTARFRIEVIQVPLAHPEQAKVVNSPHFLADLKPAKKHVDPPNPAGAGARGGAGAGARGGAGAAAGGAGAAGAAGAAAGAGRAAGGGGAAGAGAAAGGAARGGAGGAAAPPGGRGGRDPADTIGQNGCHDITSYPALGYAGGACAGYGLLFDIRDTKNPKRVGIVADSNMAFWHSATFSNDGTKLLFSDEWGGGSQPRCRATDPLNWGGNAIFTLDNGQMHFKSYYKMPAPQADNETCTAHNGSLIPVPGRDIMIQAFYQGGATVFDFTDASHPIEIAFFDRGPGGGYWSVYYYNGVIVGSDERRGMDVHELVASPYLSQNEIDAAKSIQLPQMNTQQQVHFVWPATFALAGAYLDQLERDSGIPAARVAAIRSGLASAKAVTGSARRDALTKLGTSVSGDLSTATDKGRVQLLARAVQDLSKVQ